MCRKGNPSSPNAANCVGWHFNESSLLAVDDCSIIAKEEFCHNNRSTSTCGWCHNTDRCLPKIPYSQQPIFGHCNKFQHNASKPTLKCEDLTDLNPCIQNKSCQWNTVNKKCELTTTPTIPSLSDKICLHHLCDTCTTDENCIWCDTTSSCIARDTVVYFFFFFSLWVYFYVFYSGW
jgi:hypothetical protein